MLSDEIQGFIERSQARRAEIQDIITERQVQSAQASRSIPRGRPVGDFKHSSGRGGHKGTGSVPKHGKISLNELARRIAMHESGGNPSATGEPISTGDRAYGKYQIMGNNIPSWTKEYLGKSLTPQQFLNRPKAQNKVAKGKLKYYYKRYGAGGAAAAWYGGESVAKEWKNYRNKNIGPTGTVFPSIFEYVKDILKGK